MAVVRTPAEALEAGRRHARERGDRLSPQQAEKLAALLGPSLRKNRADLDSKTTAA